MGALLRSMTWDDTALGPVEHWPNALRIALSILLGSHQPMLLWWGKELIQFYNDAYRPMLGSNRHPAAIGQKASECWKETWPTIEPLISAVFSGRSMCVRDERLLVEHDGVLKEHYFDHTYSPIRTESGEVAGVLVVCSETTEQVRERHRLEQLTESLAQQVRSAKRAKEEFLAMLGHELRNPLSPMRTALDMLRMRGEEAPEHDIMERQMSHLTRLVDDLLDVSRLTRGKLELRKSHTELAPVIARAVHMASPMLEQCRQHLDIRVPPKGLTVHVDPERMAQVFSNLLTNAAKYSHPESLISIKATCEQEHVRVFVHDWGIGIDSELLDQVFELFVQERQHCDRARGGLGLGLAIVKNLVSMHEGHVAVHSEGLGKGTTFSVDLPLVESSGLLAQRAHDESGRATVSGKRVLVVDDNEDGALLLAMALRKLGFEIKTAHDGPTALRIAENFAPEIALLDIGLPVMDGYELAQRLRAAAGDRELRLVAVTGYGQPSDKERSRAAGFDEHLVKPVDVRQVQAVITQLACKS